MKRLKRWRYYCEYCKKSGSSGGHIARHEKSCTMNPDRICKFCKHIGVEQPSMIDMLKILQIAKIKEDEDRYGITFTIENEKEAIEKLREVANNCPACMLAAIRQYTKYPMIFTAFSFPEEKKIFWDTINEDNVCENY